MQANRRVLPPRRSQLTGSTGATHAMRDLSLPKPPEEAKMPHNCREIPGMSAQCNNEWEEAHESAAIQGPK